MDGHLELDSAVFADMSHRDDLARDVAREWTQAEPQDRAQMLSKLIRALDRLAAAYGEQPEG